MAAVSLKDLMNPLTKIEEHSKSTSEKLSKIEELLVKGVGSTGASGGIDIGSLVTGQDTMIELQSTMLTQLSAQTKYLQVLADGGRSLSNLFGGGRREQGNTREGQQLLEQLGIGIKELGKGMLVWSLVPKKTITKLSFFITDTFSALASQDTKKAKEGVEILDMMGGAIFKFSGALAASAILLIPGMIAIPFLIASIGVMSGVMALIGGKDTSKRISRGAKTLDRIGDGILSFGVGLAAFAITTLFIVTQPGILVGMVASILLMGGAVALIGGKKTSKRIRRGALSLGLLGAGLAVFSIGYGLFASTTSQTSIGDVLTQSALILGIGIASALVGKFGLSNIAQGAASLALNGLGLLVFSLGYIPFAKATENIELSDILIQAGVLTAIGGVMALTGIAVAASGGTALLGPVLFAAAGGSLLLLAPGLKAMKDLKYSKEDSKDLATTLGAVAMAFSGIDPKDGVFGMIGGLFTRVMQSGTSVAAAVMYASAGVSLQKLAKGLTAFKSIGFTQEDSKDLAVALGSVSSAFAQAGGEPSNPGGLFGAVFGNTFSPNATERGVESVMKAGDALTEITKGLKSFLDLRKTYGLTSESFAKGGFLNKAIVETLGFVKTAFAAVGGEGNVDAGGFFGSVFNIKQNKVKEGVDSVSGAGKELNNIVEGLIGFIDLKNKYGLTSESFIKGGFLYEAVTSTLGFVRTAFAAVANEGNVDAGGFFGSVFNIKQNKVKEGVDAVSGAGKELTNIASGLKTFQELVDKNIDFTKDGKLSKAVKNSLTFVGDAFATIGGKEDTDSTFFGLISWDENAVKKGIDAVKGAGKSLVDIGEGLTKFSEIKNPSGLADSMSIFLQGIADVFVNTYDSDAEFSSHIDDFRRLINDIGERAADGDLEQAAKDIKSMSDAINDVDLQKAEAFGDLFKGASDITSNGGAAALSALADAVSEIRDILNKSDEGGTINTTDTSTVNANTTGAQVSNSNNTQIQTSLNRINSTLASLNTTMNSLPGNIAAIEIKLPNE